MSVRRRLRNRAASAGVLRGSDGRRRAGDGRQAGAAGAREVSPLELFYDLVFVFAVSQLSEHLLHDLTWRGAGETLVLLCAVFTVWLLTTFEVTYFDITRRHTQAAVLRAMALGLLLNAAIGVSFARAPRGRAEALSTLG